MKRMITSSSNTYSKDADKYLERLGIYGEALSKLSKAHSLDEIQQAVATLGKWSSTITTMEAALESVMDTIDYLYTDFKKANNASNNFNKVESTLVGYLEGLGYDILKMTTPPRGYSTSYVIIPADECTFEDLRTVAAAVANEFNIRPDTGVIGGSWTSYEFKLHGVTFRIGFERDYDFDTSGKESSLQLYFK